MQKSFKVMFRYRAILSLIFVLMLMLLGIVRILAICSDSKVAISTVNSVLVSLGSVRGNVYDCKGEKITSSEKSYISIFLPCEAAVVKFTELADGDEFKKGIESLKKNKPAVLATKNKINCLGVYSIETAKRYDNLFGLEHIIGYTDSQKHGVVGLEKAYDALLYSEKEKTVSFSTDALGNYLLGANPKYSNESITGNLYLTIDLSIQKICNDIAENIKKGAVVVVEAKNGKIRGMVSKPLFSVENIKKYINSSDAPLLNRCLSAYSVGSVFKPLVAAVLLEEGKENYTYKCNGFCNISNNVFYCNNRSGHGNTDLKIGLTKSCNTYFYNAALSVNLKNLTALAGELGFDSSLKLCDGISAVKGSITSEEKLKYSNAAVANFAIGQGDISLSPLVISNLYAAIANGGYYYTPTLIEGELNSNGYKALNEGNKNFVFSENTALYIKKCLTSVVEEGTGSMAKPELCSAAGKTATAQTGSYSGEKEILNSWFCGFFPANDPKYVVTVFVENGNSGGSDCAPLFKKIADKINSVKK